MLAQMGEGYRAHSTTVAAKLQAERARARSREAHLEQLLAHATEGKDAAQAEQSRLTREVEFLMANAKEVAAASAAASHEKYRREAEAVIQSELQQLHAPPELTESQAIAWREREGRLSENAQIRNWQMTVVSQQLSLAALRDLANERKLAVDNNRASAETQALEFESAIKEMEGRERMAAADTRASTLLRVELEVTSHALRRCACLPGLFSHSWLVRCVQEVKEELAVTQGHLAKQIADTAAGNAADAADAEVAEFGSSGPVMGADGRRPLPGSPEPTVERLSSG